MGRFSFKTHSVYSADKDDMNTAKDVFRTLYSKEWYRTVGFNELALDFASHMSYRQSTQKLNRVRNEEKRTPIKTLANIVESEGEKVQKEISKMAEDILHDNNFSEKGIPNNEAKAKIYIPDKRKILMQYQYLPFLKALLNLNFQLGVFIHFHPLLCPLIHFALINILM